MGTAFTLREMQPEDSAALRKLAQDDAETPGMGMNTRFVSDTFDALIHSNEHDAVGVVAETADFDGLVGMGTVSFNPMRFEGVTRPGAMLSSLKVHPQFRKQGLGWQLAQWRIEKARTMIGGEGVIITGMERANDASRATASKWCREFFEPVRVAVAPARMDAPDPLAGITVRAAEPDELAEIAENQNAFYQDMNLYQPVSAAVLTHRLNYSPVDRPLQAYFIAVSSSGEILAGAGITRRQLLMVDQIQNPPLPLRAMLPPDLTIREWPVHDLWYLPGQLRAAQYLWESLRWECQAEATSLSTTFDPRGPLADVYQAYLNPQMPIEIAFAVHGPSAMTPERLLCPPGRR